MSRFFSHFRASLMALFLVAWPSCTASAQSGIACKYEVTHIIQSPAQCLGSPVPTIGTGISPSGRYVCGNLNCIGTNYPFLYDTNTLQLMVLPVASGAFSSANDVNEEYVVGQAEGLGFIYEIATGQTTLLSPAVPPSQGTCDITAINSSNVVCGTRTIQVSPTRTSAFRWSAQTGFEDVGLINGQSTYGWGISNLGIVVGHFPENTLSNTARAFFFGSGKTTVMNAVPDGINSYTRGVGPDGEILALGLLQPAPTVLQRTYIFYGNKFEPMGVPSGCDRTYSDAMNSNRTSVGACNDVATGTWRGVVWFNTSPRLLNGMIDPALGFYIRSAVGISDGGSIVGDTETGQGARFATVLAPAPRMAGDTNCDHHVNVTDLLKVINGWGPCNGCDADLTGDQLVNVSDLLQVVNNRFP